MTKRNSNFSIYAHLRMLMRLFPARDAVLFRLAVAARIEADEATGEVFPAQGMSPRERLLATAGVGNNDSFDKAMSKVQKAGLMLPERKYAGGQRQGGNRLVLDWAKWEDVCLNGVHEPSTPLNGVQPPCTPLNGVQPTPLNGVQATPLNGVQQVKDSTAIVTAIVTAPHPQKGVGTDQNRPLNGASSSGSVREQPQVARSKKATPQPPALKLHRPAKSTPLAEQRDGLPWLSGVKAWEVWQDRAGTVCFVDNEHGEALHDKLRATYAVAHIQKALISCAAGIAFARRGRTMQHMLGAILEKHCVLAKEGRAEGSRSPGQIDYAARDALRNSGRWE